MVYMCILPVGATLLHGFLTFFLCGVFIPSYTYPLICMCIYGFVLFSCAMEAISEEPVSPKLKVSMPNFGEEREQAYTFCYTVLQENIIFKVMVPKTNRRFPDIYCFDTYFLGGISGGFLWAL